MTRGMTTCTGHKHWIFIIISAQVYTSFVQKKVLTSGFFFVEFIVDCFKMFHFCPQNYRLLYWLCIIKFIVTSLVGIKDYASKLSLLCQCGMLIEFDYSRMDRMTRLLSGQKCYPIEYLFRHSDVMTMTYSILSLTVDFFHVKYMKLQGNSL